MRTKLFFLILTLLMGSIQFNVSAAPYGEDSPSLGQLVDDYENEDNVSSAYNVWNNVTLDSMELNYTSGITEDFTSYTEVDEDGDLTITPSKIDISSLRRDAETYVWKDYTPNYFKDFVFEYEVNITDLEAGDATSGSVTGLISLSNSTGVMDDLTGGSYLFVCIQQQTDQDDKYGFYVRQFDAGVSKFIMGSVLNYHDVSAGELYARLSKSGTNVTLWMFSDQARTTLIYRYTTNAAVDHRYKYLQFSNWGRDVDGADHYSGYLENLDIGSSGYGEGYFNTTDYFDYVNGSSLVWLTNTSIPSGTSLTVQFSNDGGSTYVDNEGNAGSNTLTEGHEALDLRDLNYTSLTVRYNFTGIQSDTPRLFQSRLITTEDGAGGAMVIESDAPWIALAIILSVIAFLLATRIKR